MKGSYRIVVQNSKVRYDFEIRRNITIIKGDSATGKTTLVEMIREYYEDGEESGIFQLVKVALSSVVALFGTYQIAANGVAQSIWSMAALAGVSMGPVFITVIGQCMGKRDTEAADYYFRKLTRLTLMLSSAWNLLIFVLTPLFMKFYALEPQTKQLVIWLVLIHNIFNAVAFPFSGALSNGLRAAGDVKFTMYVSIASTIGGRLVLSYILGIGLHMGVIGIAFAMVCDWVIRGCDFLSETKVRQMEKFSGDLRQEPKGEKYGSDKFCNDWNKQDHRTIPGGIERVSGIQADGCILKKSAESRSICGKVWG